jgi:hypothetical protein
MKTRDHLYEISIRPAFFIRILSSQQLQVSARIIGHTGPDEPVSY